MLLPAILLTATTVTVAVALHDAERLSSWPSTPTVPASAEAAGDRRSARARDGAEPDLAGVCAAAGLRGSARAAGLAHSFRLRHCRWPAHGARCGQPAPARSQGSSRNPYPSELPSARAARRSAGITAAEFLSAVCGVPPATAQQHTGDEDQQPAAEVVGATFDLHVLTTGEVAEDDERIGP
jgi:hypothetical protein